MYVMGMLRYISPVTSSAWEKAGLQHCIYSIGHCTDYGVMLSERHPARNMLDHGDDGTT